MAKKKPLIGLTLDHEMGGTEGHWSKLPYYAIRENYCAAIDAAGGLPLLLPHDPAQAGDYADLLDGVVVTGGGFDLDPALYGAGTRHATVSLKQRRTAFEWAVTEAILAADKAILGICGGEQLLAVVLGGTLVQHIPDEVGNALAHVQPNPRHEPGHSVTLAPGSRLASLAGGATTLQVNSAHHQAVKTVGKDCVITALAPDGVVEALEAPGRRFAIGVQWHPEYHVSPVDAPLLAAFVEAARR